MSQVPRPAEFLETIQYYQERTPPNSAERPIRLATVDPGYSPLPNRPDPAPACRVTFEGEGTLSGKAYPVAMGFVPRGSQRVFLLPQGNGWIVAGGAASRTLQGFHQTATASGLEIGDGAYYLSTLGLYLPGDAQVAGKFKLGSGAIRQPEIQSGVVLSSTAGAVGSHTIAITFPTAWPASTTVVIPAANIADNSGSVTTQLMLRAHTISITGFTITVSKTEAARANYTWTNIPVHWVALGYPP